MVSVKKNFGYNLALTLCGHLFPLITYPYVSRVLGVQNIGICNFADSIINYFVLFSMLGIGSYGVREIARVRQDETKRNFVFSNLILINVITTIVAIVVLILCTFIVPKFSEYKPFLLVGIAKLFFSVFLIEWLYQGIQDFKYITVRSLLVRVIYVVAIFVFVHDEDSVLLYFFLTALTTIINAIINWVHARKFIRIDLKSLNLKAFILPIMAFGYYRILTSMYTTFNTVFLGFSSGDVEVGYFATATKLYALIMSVLTAFTTVMVPKVSELLHEKKTEKLQRIANQTISVVTSVSIPIILYCQFCASDIIRLIAGEGYEGAIVPFRIVIFMLLVIGSEQIIIQQFLMASTQNKPILIVSTIGAVVGVSFNFVITPTFGAIGSAVAWGVSEMSVLIAGIFFIKKILGISVPLRKTFVDLSWSVSYILPLYFVHRFDFNLIANLILSGLVTATIFMIINLAVHKNPQMIELFNEASKWLNFKRK